MTCSAARRPLVPSGARTTASAPDPASTATVEAASRRDPRAVNARRQAIVRRGRALALAAVGHALTRYATLRAPASRWLAPRIATVMRRLRSVVHPGLVSHWSRLGLRACQRTSVRLRAFAAVAIAAQATAPGRAERVPRCLGPPPMESARQSLGCPIPRVHRTSATAYPQTVPQAATSEPAVSRSRAASLESASAITIVLRPTPALTTSPAVLMQTARPQTTAAPSRQAVAFLERAFTLLLRRVLGATLASIQSKVHAEHLRFLCPSFQLEHHTTLGRRFSKTARFISTQRSQTSLRHRSRLR
jgi:hypothetical protein